MKPISQAAKAVYSLRGQQVPSIRINDRPGKIPIPHDIEITLRHILRPPNLPRRQPTLGILHEPPRRPLGNVYPQRRRHRPRTYQAHPQRRQIERQVPHHAVQARRVAGHDGPVLGRFTADGAARQADGRCGSGVEVLGRVLGEHERRVEADHGRFLYRFQRRVLELERGEVVAGRVDDVVEFRPAAAREDLV